MQAQIKNEWIYEQSRDEVWKYLMQAAGNGTFTIDTIVCWTLEKHVMGSKLLLEQPGFKDANLSIFNAMTNGWQTNMQKMINHLNTIHNDSTNA